MNYRLEGFKKDIRDRKVAVLGIGISNKPLVVWLYKLGALIDCYDKRSEDDSSIKEAMELFRREGVSVEWNLGNGYLDGFSDRSYDYIFKTPKMRIEGDLFDKASQNGSVITTEMDLFLALCPCRTFGITGSDGKTTTTTLVSEMLKTAGYKVWLGGNIGTPLLDKVEEMTPSDMVVLELSSFQLLYNHHSTDVAVVTNVTPNHLDYHHGYEEYIDAKKNIFRHQDVTGKLVVNASYDITCDMRHDARGTVSVFSPERKDTETVRCAAKVYLDEGSIVREADGVIEKIIDTSDILIPGRHNVENYMAAIEAVYGYVSSEDIRKVAAEFPGVPHRIEFIREINGVRYYNSSIDTSPNRTIHTMEALADRNMRGVLITGGADKKCPYDGLGEAVLKVCHTIIVYGDNYENIREILEQERGEQKYELINIPSDPDDKYESDATRENVVAAYRKAVGLAGEHAKEGEIVIMSPVGTSYDHFDIFEHRGDMFRDLVNSL